MHVYVKGLLAAVAAGTAAVTIAACGTTPNVSPAAQISPLHNSISTPTTTIAPAPILSTTRSPVKPSLPSTSAAGAHHDAVDNDVNDDRITGVDRDNDNDANDDRVTGVDNDANDDRVTGVDRDNDNDANDDRITGVDNDRDRGGDRGRGGDDGGHGGGGGRGRG
jgi:hypothetical protein